VGGFLLLFAFAFVFLSGIAHGRFSLVEVDLHFLTGQQIDYRSGIDLDASLESRPGP
jgi:hypothetical protein